MKIEIELQDKSILRKESGAYSTPNVRILIGESASTNLLDGGPLGFYMWDVLEGLTSGLADLAALGKPCTIRAKDDPASNAITFEPAGDRVSVTHTGRALAKDPGGRATYAPFSRRESCQLLELLVAARRAVESHLEECRRWNQHWRKDADLIQVTAQLERLKRALADIQGKQPCEGAASS